MGRVRRKLGEMRHSWNLHDDGPKHSAYGGGQSMSPRASRSPARYFNDRSFVGSIYNRLAVDLSSIEFMHALLDENDVAIDIVRDPLNDCLTLDPNIDQTSQALKQDWAMTLFETGHSCLVPVDATMDPLVSGSYDITSLRVGRATGWFPRKVMLEVYDDREVDDEGEPVNGGINKQVIMPKTSVAMVENPFYEVMNSPNGMLQRLIAKLEHMDRMDEKYGSQKLDIILQLPYTVRGDSRKTQAEGRRSDLTDQLRDDPLGIGYIDVSEKVIQLNRPVNSKTLEEIQYLAAGVMTELGITPEIMNGTASRDTINNYYDRTIEPIANGLALEIKRKFLTKTARTRRHSIEIFRDPLKVIQISELAEVVDKLRRNEVVTSNELRPKIGLRPSKDPIANELANPNMPAEDTAPEGAPVAKQVAKQVAKEVAASA